jgi:hypothetical protein
MPKTIPGDTLAGQRFPVSAVTGRRVLPAVPAETASLGQHRRLGKADVRRPAS